MRTGLALLLSCLPMAGAAQVSRAQVVQHVELRGKRVAVHIAPGVANPGGPLLLYVTGDGGFPGAERLFERMAPWGHPMAAIDTMSYVASINTPGRELTPAVVAADFQAVIRMAQRVLELPADRQIVLVGYSRGASLAVAAATQPVLQPSLHGLLLLALPPEDVFVAAEIPALPTNSKRPFRPYDALPQLGSLRVALIQSTRDQILSAGGAERRFGPEGPVRRFRALEAKDHSFGGSLPALEKEMRAALEWIVSDPK
jgi:pimeloyl-ACP methyl ester carboxylesterase